MRDYDYCKRCREFANLTRHSCPPAYRVWRPDLGDTIEDARVIYADSHESAAETWARRSDSEGDYTIVNGTDADVAVLADGEEVPKMFTVTGESVPEYHAREKT